jgi:hypothetical protein
MSGLVETSLKAHIGDKTNWRKMLQGEPELFDLHELKTELLTKASSDIEALKEVHGIQSIQDIDSEVLDIHYPVISYPEKIKSINLDKELGFTGKLMGIKGQYLILDENRVINIRKYAGYQVSLRAS